MGSFPTTTSRFGKNVPSPLPKNTATLLPSVPVTTSCFPSPFRSPTAKPDAKRPAPSVFFVANVPSPWFKNTSTTPDLNTPP